MEVEVDAADVRGCEHAHRHAADEAILGQAGDRKRLRSVLAAAPGGARFRAEIDHRAAASTRCVASATLLQREVLEDRRQVGPALGQELDVDPLWEHTGAELRRLRLGAVRGDVLQVREHEAVLEAVEEVVRHALGRRQHRAREVVVGVEHGLEVPRGEAVEHAVERRVGREHVPHRSFQREDRAVALRRLEELADRVVEQLHACRQAVVGMPPVLALRAARACLGRDHRRADARRELEAACEVLDVLAALALVGVDEVAVAGDARDRDACLLERLGPLGVVEALLDEVASELDRAKAEAPADRDHLVPVGGLAREDAEARPGRRPVESRHGRAREGEVPRRRAPAGPGGVSSTIQPS